ncbi:MAG: hypothetical protein Ct9H90mP30_4610 [Actinomycetota bacterium]|nr:MAG: hypothetical protein Ct9H90mP30_4610 [Actinomycetota bacterium]
MLVTRSNPELPKHKGMTYFALDMHAEGVEVRPLRQITGEAEFNEVYITEVRIPDSQRIGDIGEGWRVSLTTLMNERSAIGGSSGGSTSKPGMGPISDAVELWQSLPEDRRNKASQDRLMNLWAKARHFVLQTNVHRWRQKLETPDRKDQSENLLPPNLIKLFMNCVLISWVLRAKLIMTTRSAVQSCYLQMVQSMGPVTLF